MISSRYFNLSRYFSTLSFVLIVLAAGVLGLLYRHLSLLQMKELAESRNVAMTQVFENSLRQPLDDLSAIAVSRDLDALLTSEELAVLGAQTAALMHGTAVVKVKVYNRLGITIFSTDTKQIGESRLDNPGFKAAMNGAVLSELTHRNSLDTFEGALNDVDLLASYIPLGGKNGAAEGVFELYQDVTPFVRSLHHGLLLVTIGVFAVFAVLYLMQFVVVRRAQHILNDQESHLRSARDTLELRVTARTEELKKTNQRLEGEIAERRQAESKLNYLAYHDPLTGLANRRSFLERFAASMSEAQAKDRRLAVLFIDLDQFKQVNDSLGHGVGDELLAAVAMRLSERVRLIDLLARLGGDEFICLMEGVGDGKDVEILAREILATFEQSFPLGDNELYLSASSASVCIRAMAKACWNSCATPIAPCIAPRRSGVVNIISTRQK